MPLLYIEKKEIILVGYRIFPKIEKEMNNKTEEGKSTGCSGLSEAVVESVYPASLVPTG